MELGTLLLLKEKLRVCYFVNLTHCEFQLNDTNFKYLCIHLRFTCQISNFRLKCVSIIQNP